jgi:hypothetical protein
MATALHGQSAQLPSASNPSESPKIVARFTSLPLSFEANQGQADPGTKFMSRGRGYTLFLNPNEAVLSLRAPSQAARNLKLVGSRNNPPNRSYETDRSQSTNRTKASTNCRQEQLLRRP